MTTFDSHLLIVDDDERIRGLLKKFLVRAGFLVSAARDGAHARRILAGLDFDLIIMDVMMPGEDGISLTKSLRETMTTPILLLTAKGETATSKIFMHELQQRSRASTRVNRTGWTQLQRNVQMPGDPIHGPHCSEHFGNLTQSAASDVQSMRLTPAAHPPDKNVPHSAVR